MNNSPKNFSIEEKAQGFKEEELLFVTSFDKVKSMLGLPFPEKRNQVHFRQRLLLTNLRGVIILTNKKQVVGKARKDDIDKNIEDIIRKSRILLVEIAKFRAAASIDKNEEIVDCEGYTDIIGERLVDDMEELIKCTTLDAINEQILNKIARENSDFFTNFIFAVLMAAETDGVISLLQKVAYNHGYKLSKLMIPEESKVIEA